MKLKTSFLCLLGILVLTSCHLRSQTNSFSSDAFFQEIESSYKGTKVIKAINMPIENTNYYINNNWLAINPEEHKEATSSISFSYDAATYDIIFMAVGENDGKSTYKLSVNGKEVMDFVCPLSKEPMVEGSNFSEFIENIPLKPGDKITVTSTVAKESTEYSRGRWLSIVFIPMTKGKDVLSKLKAYETKSAVTKPEKKPERLKEPELFFTDQKIRKDDGNGAVTITGDLKQWDKVTLNLDGPFAHELDKDPNPFTDYKMTVHFEHESGSPSYNVPGYFAADGNAGETSADSGIKWRAHLSPDKTGKWNYIISFEKGKLVALTNTPWSSVLKPYDGISGSFEIGVQDKTGRDFRSKGRLEYVGGNYLQFQGSKDYFFKAGADAPETLLGYVDFDATYTMKSKVPLKKFEPHLKDWKSGDPTWKNGKGKGLIGAVNYLANKKVNVMSFLTYNAGGDGDNVWPYVSRNEKYHFDCSKLDQWQLVFDYAQLKGIYLHFKTQETENDDNIRGKSKKMNIKESLDSGDLGPERRLYYRELLARYSYLLALNWNLGEENTQSTKQQQDMAQFFNDECPYKQNIVIHTYPSFKDKIYTPLLGDNSKLTGASLQNSWKDTHKTTLKWVTESNKAGRPWVVANDEQGSAGNGVPPDPGYKGYDENTTSYGIDDVRIQTLWGNLMAGGAGVEYYFGYKLPENDLVCEDFRSRDRSWDFCKIAIEFFEAAAIPFNEMSNQNTLIGNPENKKEKYCLAKTNDTYLVYLGYVSTTTLDLTSAEGSFNVRWFNPRTGGKHLKSKVRKVKGGQVVDLGNPPSENDKDWVVIVQKKK